MSKREISFSGSGQNLRNESGHCVDLLSPTSLFHDSPEPHSLTGRHSINGHALSICDLESIQIDPFDMEQGTTSSSAWIPSTISPEHVSMPINIHLDDRRSIEDINTSANPFVRWPEPQASNQPRSQQRHTATEIDAQRSGQPLILSGISGRRSKRGAQPDHTHSDATDSDGDSETEKKRKNRAKNKVAAAKCRRTKRMHKEAVEAKHRELSAENAELKVQQRHLHATVIQLRTWALAHQDCTCGVRQFNMMKAKHMYMAGGLDDRQTVVRPNWMLASSINPSTMM